jgi:hypothetical protein
MSTMFRGTPCSHSRTLFGPVQRGPCRPSSPWLRAPRSGDWRRGRRTIRLLSRLWPDTGEVSSADYGVGNAAEGLTFCLDHSKALPSFTVHFCDATWRKRANCGQSCWRKPPPSFRPEPHGWPTNRPRWRTSRPGRPVGTRSQKRREAPTRGASQTKPDTFGSTRSAARRTCPARSCGNAPGLLGSGSHAARRSKGCLRVCVPWGCSSSPGPPSPQSTPCRS